MRFLYLWFVLKIIEKIDFLKIMDAVF